ncbi:hypothetical protein BDZ89DRAFT_1079646, partial [Hymenopellis radicata]
MPLNPIFRQGTRAITNSLTSHRLLLYGALSTIAVCAAVANALRNYTNFYSVAIYLSKSSRSVLIFANFGFILALLAGHLVQKIFFGTLRANEVERLYDRLWIFVTESLLAFTIFRDEFDAPFAIMFGSLLFIKSFHWLAADRIEWMDQRPYPGPSLLFHIRMSTLFLILWTADMLMLLFAVENTLTYGVGGMVLFACEYGILLATAANTIAKYLLSVYDFRRASTRGGENAPPWEQKSIWTFYFELVTDFSKLTTYLCFFTIILTFYGLPLNIVRDIYFTARSFVTRLKALRRYQTATRNMDERYPNATPEEMAASDHTCIICREEMILPAQGAQQAATEGPNTTPKKLPCGHIFHFHCLRSWLERQQSCPTCRRTVLETNPPNRPTGTEQPERQAAGVGAGAAPQPNPAAQNGNRNPAPDNANNNAPMDLIRRLMANVPQNQNRGNAANQPVNVIIQYDVHNYGANQQAPPPTAERRPPQFSGFHGPGGVWQPWQVEGIQGQDQLPPSTSVPSTGSTTTSATAPASNSSSSSSVVPQPTPTVPAPSSTTSSDPAESTLPEQSLPSNNPREAAALAALRRFDSQTSTSSTPIPSSDAASNSNVPFSTESVMARPRSRSSTPESLNESIPHTTYSGPSTSTPSQASHSATSTSLSNSTGEPSSGSHSTETPSQSTNAGPSSSSTLPGGIQIQLPSLIPLDLNPNIPRRSAPFSPPPSSSSSRSIFRPATRLQRPLMTPLAQLPPTLTPEQLATMDRVTREAIDERLRVLEGVSGAVYRCIDELMRVRSALPPTGNAVTPVQSVPARATETTSPIPET